MRVLEVGCGFHHSAPTDSADFRSTQTFLDYDLLIWNPSEARDEYYVAENIFISNGRTLLKKSTQDKLLTDLTRRQGEIVEMMRLGRSVVVWTPDPQATTVTVTSSNRTRDVNLLDVLPVDVETSILSGRNIEFRGAEPFARFWNDNQDRLIYNGQIVARSGRPLFFVKGTDKVVGTHFTVGRGNLLLLPALPSWPPPSADKGLTRRQYGEVERDYVLSVVRLVEDLKRMVGEPELPAWSRDYLLPSEHNHLDRLEQLKTALKQLQQKIHYQENLLAELEKYKIMFGGSGKPLEQQVRKVFEELGFKVVQTEQNRDDLLLTYGDRVAVVEIKGTSKSAAEKNAAQLEKWVSEYYLTHGVEPKGILLVNAFRNTPLVDRKEAAFPDQMICYSERREHCLLTGLQLLGLYLDCKDNPDKRAEMVDLIFETQGRLDRYQDWTTYLVWDGSGSARDER